LQSESKVISTTNLMTQGGGGCLQNCHVTFFSKKMKFSTVFDDIQCQFEAFNTAKIIFHVTVGGGGGPHLCHKMTHGGRGSKIGKKILTYYLNGP
jgi:hypothetical protein